MKAPDKIFLPGDIDWPSAAILTLGNQPGDVEYIRKDYLLKKIRKIAIWNTIKVGKKEIRDIVTEIIESI